MISPDDRSQGVPKSASPMEKNNNNTNNNSGTVPRCVCSWKNCRTYQKGFREAKHTVFDGTIKLKFVKDHPASQALKDSVDRALRVPPERAEDWKPGKKEGQLVARYHVARHHYTEKHIQKYLADPKGFSFLKPFSVHGAKKYLFTVDPNETFQVGDSNETLYLQAPNVPKEVVKAEFMRLKESYAASNGNTTSSNNNNNHENVNTTNNTSQAELSPSKSKETQPSSTTVSGKPQAPEKKDSMTVSTTRSQQLLEKEVKSKEIENKKLKDELDTMKSQLTFLHDMVRKLQEEHFDSHTQAGGDHVSVRSGRSYRSRSISNRPMIQVNNGGGGGAGGGNSSRSARSGVPRDIIFGEDDQDGDEWDPEPVEDWTEYQDDNTDTQNEETEEESGNFEVTYKAARRMSNGTQASRGAVSIVSASKSIKTLPRELELDEDEDDSDNESLEDDRSFVSGAFNRGGYHSRGSTHSRSGHSQRRGSTHSRSGHNQPTFGGGGGGIVMQPEYGRPNAMSDTAQFGGNSAKPFRPSRRSSIGESSYRSAKSSVTSQSAGTYEVSAMVVTDPYGEKGTYTGSISNSTGMPHGYGRLEYDRAGRWYEGDWKHGRWTGHGRLSNGDGDFYEGGLKNDHKHGHGIMKFADGRTFEGEYINGQMIEGLMTYQDGSTYEGSWVDGMRHGRGKCVFTDDSVYEGEFREGEFSGQGRMTWSDGGCYQGEWWNGEMHGIGKEIRPDGSIRHDGEWCKGQPLRK